MIAVVIRAMWDAARLLMLAVVGGLSFAVWSVVAIGVITGRI